MIFVVALLYGICAAILSIVISSNFGIIAQLLFLPFMILGGLLLGYSIASTEK